ncbi:LysR family transcriptional regulator [Rhodophyticola porphyridii]|uniref:LysR family transcriptional regulator n=1 Tax=Rhodophyticola porphyridii TaxID=1852017 RepID=UPI001B0A4F33|nr:LysR family transcriptional regulator [Roseicyclus sp.]MBO6625851.1 LysR family transcriptional regulator [Roseicyclus sp.]MBO6923968.1 LysR family transcriptional regulator [Roseicyclus sp.]
MAKLNYTHLRAFHAVAHEGNLTRAAESLGVAQSAVSTQIKTLEERLGHALFERRGRALHLTEAGRIALDYADTAFDAGTELVETLAGRGAARQVLRVGALATLSRNFQLSFLRPLLGQPDVSVVLRAGSLGELLAELEALRLDVVLLNEAPRHDAATPWRSHRIDDQPVRLVGHPHRLPAGRPVADILRDTPLVLPAEGSTLRSQFDRICDRIGVTPVIAAEADDMAMLRLLVREDAGLALVPPIVVRDELEAGLLVEAEQLEDLHEAFWAITLPRQFPNPLLARVLRDTPRT